MHKFTTSFLFGGRCRKAMLGVRMRSKTIYFRRGRLSLWCDSTLYSHICRSLEASRHWCSEIRCCSSVFHWRTPMLPPCFCSHFSQSQYVLGMYFVDLYCTQPITVLHACIITNHNSVAHWTLQLVRTVCEMKTTDHKCYYGPVATPVITLCADITTNHRIVLCNPHKQS